MSAPVLLLEEGDRTCPKCDGSGYEGDHDEWMCGLCGGDGEIGEKQNPRTINLDLLRRWEANRTERRAHLAARFRRRAGNRGVWYQRHAVYPVCLYYTHTSGDKVLMLAQSGASGVIAAHEWRSAKRYI